MFRFFIVLALIIVAAAPAIAAPTIADIQAAVIREDFKKVNDAAQELIAAKPSRADSLEARYYLGLSQLRLGEYVHAEQVFKKLLAERPADDLYDRAAVGHFDSLYLQGFYEKALKEITDLISRRGNSEMISLFYLKSARANLKLARWDKAQEFLHKLVSDYSGTFEGDVARQLLEEKQYFTVQVGSFTEKPRAERLVQELTQRKEYAYMVEIRGAAGKAYYRVRVGQLSALKDAKELETKLAGLGYPTLIYP
jgi:tetratricopeptide (TPR) repeat protein